MSFTDVTVGKWYYESVKFVIEKRLMSGASDGLFEPEAALTTVQLAAVLYLTNLSLDTILSGAISNAPDEHDASASLTWAYDKGVFPDAGAGIPSASDTLSREQLAIALYNYSNHIGVDVSALISSAGDISGFSDKDKISDQAITAMRWCVSNGIIIGTSAATLEPGGTVTRAQCATVLQRFIDSVIPVTPLPAPQPDDSVFGVDVNINMTTIDNWLGRNDIAYRDVRLLFDTADFEAIGGISALTKTIKGFKIVPYPYMANLAELPVPGAYEGKTLFTVTWQEDGGIASAKANYVESMMILEELFPKDMAVFLMCGGAGYASEMRALLLYLGWNEKLLYNVGGNWNYTGKNSLELIVPPKGSDDKEIFATWRADYGLFSFEMLTPISEESVCTSTVETEPRYDFKPPLTINNGPLPLPQPDDTMFGVDVNINMTTIDNWLGRNDVVYRDMRMLFDPAEFEKIGGYANLTQTIRGFKIVPFPYLATLPELPVPGGYNGRALFDVDWTETGAIQHAEANYEESMMILEELFPKSKAIFLMCGGAGYAHQTRALLQYFGWDSSLLYVVGANWEYNGNNILKLILTPADEKCSPVYATWRADYAYFNFEMLYPYPHVNQPPPEFKPIDPLNPGCSIVEL